MSKSHQLPSVSEILHHLPNGLSLPIPVQVKIIRTEIAIFRERLRKGKSIPERDTIVKMVVDKVRSEVKPSLRQVINGTGIVLHTGFGRAPLSAEILNRISQGVTGYSNLEFDLIAGKRGNRLDHIRTLVTGMCGAEDALVVNNNAAAILLALNTLADGKDVIISRGQLVEIGGSFRIPDIIAKSGCILREVGTTNRTHLQDYEQAITKNTGCLLWVHTSNYKVEGFTKNVSLSDLVALGKKKRLPVVADLGSGALISLNTLGLPEEIPVHDVVKTGVSLVTFSGDKLLGGPQSGFVVGRTGVVKRLHRNPLYRTIRCDKLILAAICEILRTYSEKGTNEKNLALSLLRSQRSELAVRGENLLTQIPNATKTLNIELVPSVVEAGSGSLPTEKIESMALSFRPERFKPHELAAWFRQAHPPVVGYIEHRTFFIDLKAVLPDQYADLATAVNAVAEKVMP
ncbi:MAG: L-seryl-tRNA(Sec) selenium transferase [Fidelibacterota bacterium]